MLINEAVICFIYFIILKYLRVLGLGLGLRFGSGVRFKVKTIELKKKLFIIKYYKILAKLR